MRYTGRFAPSPTGPLHFGSLAAALASWLDARAAGGTWLLRIEDLDKPREQPGAADTIMRQLERLGLSWDGPVLYQSARGENYRAALAALGRRGATYPCGCTRSEIADSALAIDGARIYPGTCRGGLAPGRIARATRVRTASEPIRFTDRVQGDVAQSVEREVGDFVLCRADGIFAYQLAVVVDDADQGVTDVVRGADLLDSTARQIWLQRLLGYPSPRYLHLPAALTAGGEKLSKQTGARAIDPARPSRELARALAFLGQPVPEAASASELLQQAFKHWDISLIPRVRAAAAPP
ncbi:MAG TPA: tRNA glutamyl-Q(34) synthetase GluQRS [Burkholderiales bacterium]|nr:tRNA glutamyl-Q(34) synthetase GluQRS [Burkholderiales bacterium]